MKKLLLNLFLYLLVVSAMGQTPSNYYDRMQHVFGAIDKNKVTTGLLKEFGVRFNEVEAYNGTLGYTNHIDKTQWRSLYYSLHTMRVGTATTMTDPDLVYAHLDNQQAANPGTILLTALHYQYQQYKTNAYTNGDVMITSDRIYDVAGRNPYDIKTAFAVAPLQTQLKGNTFNFRIPSNMFYANTSKALSLIGIDFGNGQGYQNINLNYDQTVSYSSGGEKIIKTRFTYTDGTVVYSQAKLHLDYSSPAARYTGGNRRPPFTREATKLYQGVAGVGEVTVECAGTDNILDKPLIVVEGFDALDTFDYFDFIDEANESGSILIELDGTTGLTLNQAIEDEGYDLVFVNYANGRDYIQRNAFMLEAVIAWVNSNKVAGSQKNVILGMSMGGLVARYALRDMEINNLVHDTKFYISHDSPHQGVNVPLAAQSLVRHLYGVTFNLPVFLSLFNVKLVAVKDLAPRLVEVYNLVQSPAAQQMMIYQASGQGSDTGINTTPLQASFMNEYKI